MARCWLPTQTLGIRRTLGPAPALVVLVGLGPASHGSLLGRPPPSPSLRIRTEKEKKHTGTNNISIEITAFDLKGNFSPNFIKTFQSIASKDDHVVFISNEGEVSSILANGFVEQLDFENIYSLKGGIQNWINEGRHLKK